MARATCRFFDVQPSQSSGCTATYRGTGGTFLRAGGWAVLLDVGPGDPLVARCWARLQVTSDVHELVETLVTHGPGAAPTFALVRESDVPRLVASGVVDLVLDETEAVIAVADQHPGGLVDLFLADVSTVTLALPADEPSAPVLPLRDGVAAAASVHLDLTDPSGGDDRTARWVPRADDTQPFVATLDARMGEAATSTARVRRPAPRAPSPDVEADGPRVLATVCPEGHLTPAYAGLCRVCRRAVGPQAVFETTRPVLGRLLLPQGGTVTLDRGAVLGRAPHVPTGWVGVQPRLITLPDPDQDVSAQHLSVVLDLWDVLVCDLGSTNGTALVDRAGRVTQLRAYEPAPLRAGGVIVLGDVVTLAYEVQP